VTCLLLSLALASAGGSAQLPPLDEREKNLPAGLLPMVRAEHAFARLSVAKGMKEAFLTFAADDGILFRDAPVNAKELWRQRNPAPTGLLTWFPVYADVARAGDMGYTTGPWEFRQSPSDKDAAGHGHFITVWRVQPDGTWKFAVDIGINNPAPAGGAPALQFPPEILESRTGGGGVSVEATRAALLEAERALAGEAAKKGATEGLLAHAAEGMRLYRQNSFPAVGREAARAALKGRAGAVTWQPLKADVSRSGDLGYAFGTYAVKEKPEDAKPSEQGSYVRIWKKHGGRWRVVLDVTNPARPAA
jgi:ketosteroid isomerase-like protein